MTQPTEPNLPDDASVTPQWPSQPGASQPGDEPGFAMPTAAPVPPAPAYGPFPKTSNNAIAALILSIVAWVVCPIIPAIIALVFANKAEKEIAVSNGWVTGGGLVTASKIVSWINIGLYAALLAIGVLVLILAAVGGAFSSM